MRRVLWIVGLALVCSAVWAMDAPPVGTFEGTGTWRALDGSSGEYTSRVIITQDRITVEAEYEHQGTPHKERHSMTLQPKGAGFYELLGENGEIVGQLACLDDQCSYSVQQEGLVAQESWRLSAGELQKFGSKEVGGFKVVWKETLYAR